MPLRPRPDALRPLFQKKGVSRGVMPGEAPFSAALIPEPLTSYSVFSAKRQVVCFEVQHISNEKALISQKATKMSKTLLSVPHERFNFEKGETRSNRECRLKTATQKVPLNIKERPFYTP